MSHAQTYPSHIPLSLEGLALSHALTDNELSVIKRMDVAECEVEIAQGALSLWLIVRRGQFGGFAVRMAYAPDADLSVSVVNGTDRRIELTAKSVIGDFSVCVYTPNSEEASIRCTTSLTPSADLFIPYWPRDLYPIGKPKQPFVSQGVVKASQRGLNAGLVYLSLDEPAFGSLLYFQNYTALNDYFEATRTIPDGSVGGTWPELGYRMPPTTDQPLTAGITIVISDVLLGWSEKFPVNPKDSARLFLDLLSTVYRRIDHISTEYRNWPSIAVQTVQDLTHSPDATTQWHGHTYLHPYTGAEYPDSMVQLTVLMALREYAARDDNAAKLSKDLRAGVGRFFDKELGVLRRYLPNVGKDKNKDEVDSWYLYHPMANLGRLAVEGDEEAAEQFLQSVAFGIKVAQHFKYEWPVQFDIRSLDVIKTERKPGDPGQSDTGGLFAYVMIQAYHLTENSDYLEEAKRAIKALSGLQFELEYQANITGWAANACLQLSRITGDQSYLDQSYVFLAGFFHNSIIWESEIANAKHYRNFLAPTCLHDGPYMALYECYESFAAFHEYLTWGKTSIPESVQMLLSEYCKYALTRAWYYYPAHLPESILSQQVRNGRIDRGLTFPLEDLYADGQPAGQVGQEIYGCGAAFALVTRSYHQLKKSRIQLYSEYPVFDLTEGSNGYVVFRTRGVEGFYGRARLIAEYGQQYNKVRICDTDGRAIRPHRTPEGDWEFRVPASKGIEVWLMDGGHATTEKTEE